MTFTGETATGTLMPAKFCDIGIHQTYLTFVFCLLVDFVLILYGDSSLVSLSVLTLT